MSSLSSKSADSAVETARWSLTSLAATLAQTTNRERIALCAVAVAALALCAGGLGYRAAHSGAADNGPANVVLRPPAEATASVDDAPSAPVDVAARGDDSDGSEKGAATSAPVTPTATTNALGDAASPDGVAADGAGKTDIPPSGASGPLVVYVTGAVKRPGVYTFRAGDRLYHAVRAAGGFKVSARQDALNLADRLADGDQLYIPSRKSASADAIVTSPAPSQATVRPTLSFMPSSRASAMARSLDTPPSFASASRAGRGRVLGTVPPVAVVRVPVAASVFASGDGKGGGANDDAGEPRAPAAPAKFKNPGDGVVNINTATAAELEKISGIGPAMSARILEYRAQIGRFNDPQQLMDVKGIGEKKFAKMQPFIVVQ